MNRTIAEILPYFHLNDCCFTMLSMKKVKAFWELCLLTPTGELAVLSRPLAVILYAFGKSVFCFVKSRCTHFFSVLSPDSYIPIGRYSVPNIKRLLVKIYRSKLITFQEIWMGYIIISHCVILGSTIKNNFVYIFNYSKTIVLSIWLTTENQGNSWQSLDKVYRSITWEIYQIKLALNSQNFTAKI